MPRHKKKTDSGFNADLGDELDEVKTPSLASSSDKEDLVEDLEDEEEGLLMMDESDEEDGEEF